MEAEFYLGGGPVLIIWAVMYVYFAFSLMTIAKKTGTENGWFAWVPILNVVLMCQIADKPVWWLMNRPGFIGDSFA